MRQRLAGEGFTFISFTGEGRKRTLSSPAKHTVSIFSSTRKGALAFFGQAHSVLILPPGGESDHYDLIFGGLAF